MGPPLERCAAPTCHTVGEPKAKVKKDSAAISAMSNERSGIEYVWRFLRASLAHTGIYRQTSIRREFPEIPVQRSRRRGAAEDRLRFLGEFDRRAITISEARIPGKSPVASADLSRLSFSALLPWSGFARIFRSDRYRIWPSSFLCRTSFPPLRRFRFSRLSHCVIL